MSTAAAAFNRKLIHLCDIRDNSTEPPPQGPSGAPIPDWDTQPVTATEACRFVEKDERLADERAGFPRKKEHLLLLKSDTVIQETSKVTNIRFADGTPVNDAVWIVEDLLPRNTSGPHHVSVKLERVDDGRTGP
jgi:hypothetical protein